MYLSVAQITSNKIGAKYHLPEKMVMSHIFFLGGGLKPQSPLGAPLVMCPYLPKHGRWVTGHNAC